jgi:hypothetical protein
MKKLGLYGYSEADDKQLLKLREVSIFADSKQVRAVSEFLFGVQMRWMQIRIGSISISVGGKHLILLFAILGISER